MGTMQHMQVCHRTHGARIARHDALVTYVQRSLKKTWEIVEKEPHIKTSKGLRKPDLVAKKGETVMVVDAQVVGEQTDLQAAHERKVEYYRSSLDDLMRTRMAAQEIKYTSITLSCRGIWCSRSAKDLYDAKILPS